ncbi:hypothetical protein [uncultured Tateyamaria sp.]|uniref:hypothetical protein n=1 Tax=uncultured Tateyamaria sp. TaxID=455651 RepID=UPI0026063B33|nr:hypothetical protein [uncultured Tateyamaria sp.]
MTFRTTLIALFLAATPLVAQEEATPAPLPSPTATPAFDVDCTDEASVLAEMESRELQEMVAVREFCVQEVERLAEALGPNARGEDAFKAALNRLDLEIATLKIFQADLLSGGRIDNALRRTKTEIEALEEEARRQREQASTEEEIQAAEEIESELLELRARYDENKASMDGLKAQVDEDLAGLLDDAPAIALRIRVQGLEAAIQSQEVVVTATETLLGEMRSLQDKITEGQETN